VPLKYISKPLKYISVPLKLFCSLRREISSYAFANFSAQVEEEWFFLLSEPFYLTFRPATCGITLFYFKEKCEISIKILALY